MGVKLLPTVDALPDSLRRFMDRVTAEQTLLLVLKRDLYEGQWEPMVADLEHRLQGKPHVLRLAERIEDDLERITQMASLEQQYQVDLSVYLEPLTQDAGAEADS
ncbi:MAG: hypothetical protein WD294_09470 [Phycisphaeraceae bacterium]